MMRKFLTLRWLITTFLAVLAVAGMARLGLWQLDRLAERRAFNARVQAQMVAPPLDLNAPFAASDLYEMEYREVVARGVFDPQQEILLRNQVWENRPGFHLLTPLRLESSGYVVLVDRGFIDLDQEAPGERAAFTVSGPVEVRGIFRRPHVPRVFGVPDPTLAPGQARLDAWNALDFARIQQQIDGTLLPVYILAAPDPARSVPPYAQLEQPDLSEGPHMGYALQWFSFATILALGYPFFVRKQLAGGEKQGEAAGKVLPEPPIEPTDGLFSSTNRVGNEKLSE